MRRCLALSLACVGCVCGVHLACCTCHVHVATFARLGQRPGSRRARHDAREQAAAAHKYEVGVEVDDALHVLVRLHALAELARVEGDPREEAAREGQRGGGGKRMRKREREGERERERE